MFIFRHRSSLILAGLLTALVCLPTSVSAQLPACEPATNPGIQPTFPQDSAQDALSEDNTQNNAYTDTRYGSIGDITYLKPIEQQNALKNIEAINPTGVFNTYDTQSLRGSVHGPGDPDPNNPQLPGNIFSALNVNAAYKDSMWRDGQQATDFAQRTIHMLGAQFFAMGFLESGPGKTRASSGSPFRHNYDKKFIIGSLSHASALYGVSNTDDAGAIGAVNEASTNFLNDFLMDLPGGGQGTDLDPDPGLTFSQRIRHHWALV
jgi:hypothetical protein